MTRFIDISVTLDDRVPVWPGDPAFETAAVLAMDRGDAVNASKLCCSVHVGTHVDSPRHHFADGSPVDELPLDVLVGPAFVADLRGVPEISAADLQAARIPPGVTRLLLETDNSALWRTPGGRFRHDYVALTHEAAEWVVSRGIRLLGCDYLSVEQYGAEPPLVHRTLLGAAIIIVEGLNLHEVPSGRYGLICLPLKLKGLEGAPARAILMDGVSVGEEP